MVKLLFDIGNSRCKCARYDGADWHHYPPVEVGANNADICIPAQVDSAVGAVVVASVRSDEFNRGLSNALVARFGVAPVFAASARVACGVTTAYRNVASLGVDRFLALVGAWRRVGGACVVADCGTAVTVDAVNGNGVHQGGLIMPGLQLLQRSLGGGADRLPVLSEVGNEATDILFARDTESAIVNGCRRMFTHAVVDAIGEMRAQFADGAVLLTTGGDGALPLEMESAARYYPHLVLEGLAVFSEQIADCN